MKMRVGQRSVGLMGTDKFIPIWNEEINGYTLWVNDDPQAPEECREYAQKVAAILNTAPALQVETLRQAQDENERLRAAIEMIVNLPDGYAVSEIKEMLSDALARARGK